MMLIQEAEGLIYAPFHDELSYFSCEQIHFQGGFGTHSYLPENHLFHLKWKKLDQTWRLWNSLDELLIETLGEINDEKI